MDKLTELKDVPITTDEQLEAWKATWDGKSYPPESVHRYMREVVFPRQDRLVKNIAAEFVKDLDEN